MQYLITGATGQLGYAGSLVLSGARLLSRYELDISNKGAVVALDVPTGSVLVNTAAFTDTQAAESESLSAYEANAVGPLYLAKKTKEAGAILVHFSTDYVFDGAQKNYTEEDIVHPINVYGLTKCAGEHAVRAYNPRHYIIRTSALFGPQQDGQDTNFVTKRLMQMKDSKEITMVSDQTTVPTYTLDLMHAVKELVETGAPFGTYHIVNSGGGVSWYEFTREIASCINNETTIRPVETDISSDVMRRPMCCVLQAQKLQEIGINLPDWKKSLENYVDKISI